MPPRIIKHIEHLFKKILQLPYTIVFRKGNNSRLPVNPTDVKSILILRPDKLGDMIVTIPVIHAFKEKFPHIRLELMASPKNKSVVENDPKVDQIHLYTKNILKDWPVIRRLRRKGFDIIYDPICHDSATGLLLTKIIGKSSLHAASRKLELQKYYDYCEKYEPDGDDHNIDNGLLIFNVFGVNPRTVNPFHSVFLPESSKNLAKKFLGTLPSGDYIWVGVNISAGSPSRTLSVEKYAAIIGELGRKHTELRFVIICVMENREEAGKLVAGSNSKAFIVPENLSLLDASAILGKLDIFISPDTSLIHIAGLMKIPVIGLYSGHKRNFLFWKPYRQQYGAVVAKNINNLYDIEPVQVVEQFELIYNDFRQQDHDGPRRAKQAGLV